VWPWFIGTISRVPNDVKETRASALEGKEVYEGLEEGRCVGVRSHKKLSNILKDEGVASLNDLLQTKP